MKTRAGLTGWGEWEKHIPDSQYVRREDKSRREKELTRPGRESNMQFAAA